jgi:hypothetical protein
MGAPGRGRLDRVFQNFDNILRVDFYHGLAAEPAGGVLPVAAGALACWGAGAPALKRDRSEISASVACLTWSGLIGCSARGAGLSRIEG